MRIKIDQRWELASDKHNFILERYEVAEKGKHKGNRLKRHEKFFSTLEQAVDFLLEQKLRESDVKDLIALRADIRLMHQSVLTALSRTQEGS
jgi:uncharacterized protein (UPF0303 family)